MCELLSKLQFKDIISLLAFLVSIFAIWLSTRNYTKNVRLSIHNNLIKLILEKSRDCNQIWDGIIQEKKQNNPNFDLISEIIITTELINKLMCIYKKNYKSLKKEYLEDYKFIFWKQLNTGLRVWLNQDNLKEKHESTIYKQQIDDIKSYFNNHIK
jgi:hypothetical protein